MPNIRIKTSGGRASQLDVGVLDPLVYAQRVANALGEVVTLTTQKNDGKWDNPPVEVYPTTVIVPLSPTIVLAQLRREGLAKPEPETGE